MREKENKRLSTRTRHIDEITERRETVGAMIKRYDDASLWDGLQARDVPVEMIEAVSDKLRDGWTFQQIRRQLGIPYATSKSWKKIMSAIRQGVRIDGTAFLVQKAHEMQAMSDKLRDEIMKAFKKGTPMLVKEGRNTKLVMAKGPTKEIAGYVDAYNRLNQGFVKLGKDLGAFIDHDGKGPSGGVTIVVQNNVPLPDQNVVEAHHEKMRERDQQLIEDGKLITTSGVTLNETPES